MNTEYIMVLGFLTVAAVCDLISRRIPLILIAGQLVITTGYEVYQGIQGVFDLHGVILSLLPGAALVLLCVVTEHAVGLGDGLAVLVTGPVIGALATFEIMACAFILGAVISVFLLVIAAIAPHGSMKQMGMKSRIPFIPALAAAAVIVAVIRMH